jgi:hypothetical protein
MWLNMLPHPDHRHPNRFQHTLSRPHVETTIPATYLDLVVIRDNAMLMNRKRLDDVRYKQLFELI